MFLMRKNDKYYLEVADIMELPHLMDAEINAKLKITIIINNFTLNKSTINYLKLC